MNLGKENISKEEEKNDTFDHIKNLCSTKTPERNQKNKLQTELIFTGSVHIKLGWFVA